MSDDTGMTFLDGTQECREDPELFFPGDNDEIGAASAKAVCSRCSVQRECAAYALTHGVDGVWGGLTYAERRSLQRRHGLTVHRIQYDRPSSGDPTPAPISTGFDDTEERP